MKHLSVRVSWHDSGWNGRVCRCPKENNFCIASEFIRENKNPDAEDKHRGKPLNQVTDKLCRVPCSAEIGIYSPHGYDVTFNHPVENWNIPSTHEAFAPYTLCPAPYRWMQYDEFEGICQDYELQLPKLTSDDRSGAWIGNTKLQEMLINAFWDHIIEKKSLVTFYCNSTPVGENERQVIIGIGRIGLKEKLMYYGSSAKKPGKNPVWQRRVRQNYPAEGFRMPYQEYLAQGLDPETILVTAPPGFEEQFKYVAEHVSDSAMLALVEDLIRVVELIETDVTAGRIRLDDDWGKHKRWLQGVLGELWKSRGKNPGVANVLRFLGFPRGMTYQQHVLVSIEEDNNDTIQHVVSILDTKSPPEPQFAHDFDLARRKWAAYSKEPPMRRLLELLMRIDVDARQIERIMKPQLRLACGIEATEEELVENPYLIAEQDKGEWDKNELISDPVSLDAIDQAMVPSYFSPIAFPPDDDRRVRSIMIEALAQAAEEGSTVVSIATILDKIEERFNGDRACKPDLVTIQANKKFYEEEVEFLADNNFVALRSEHEDEEYIASKIEEIVRKRCAGTAPDWDAIIRRRFGSPEESKIGEESENEARAEKKEVLEQLFKSGFSVLTGRAGTGKTEALSIFLEGLIGQGYTTNDFAILAPTGKARVRIRRTLDRSLKAVGLEPLTIHQHLRRLGWLDKRMRFVHEGGRQTAPKVVIVDESSMLTTNMLAALLRSLLINHIERLVLVGDSNQLPPIGPGRPFDDIIHWLAKDKTRREMLGALHTRVRHEDRTSKCLRLADTFLRDTVVEDAEDIFGLIEQKKLGTDDDLKIKEWNDYDELIASLDCVLAEIGINDYNSYRESVGLKEDKIEKCESWQALSPLKHKQVSGTAALNTYLQTKFLGQTLEKWRTAPWLNGPFGKTKDIVHEDKVIQIENRSNIYSQNNPEPYVANGEIGLVKYYNNNKGERFPNIKVQFSDQPEYYYSYANGERNTSVESNLDLAYAITIHKAQGSDFEKVILVIPKNTMLSTEMMYTALTRARKKTYLLIQGGIETLEASRKASRSDTDRRNTCLFELSIGEDNAEVPFADRRIHITNSGFAVRSKSEVIVANELLHAGIPLTEKNYEVKFFAKDGSRQFKWPDFVFDHGGKTIIWEHFGMLSVPSYKKKADRKLEWYAKNLDPSREVLIISKDGLDGSISTTEILELMHAHGL